MRVAEQLEVTLGITTSEEKSPKHHSKEIKDETKEKHVTAGKKKPKHGYLFRTRQSVTQENPNCRLCRTSRETIQHIVAQSLVLQCTSPLEA